MLLMSRWGVKTTRREKKKRGENTEGGYWKSSRAAINSYTKGNIKPSQHPNFEKGYLLNRPTVKLGRGWEGEALEASRMMGAA